MTKHSVGKNIKRYRRLNHVTQEQLSKMTCVPRTSIARYEIGMYYPPFENAVKIADALGIKVDDLTKEVEKNG